MDFGPLASYSAMDPEIKRLMRQVYIHCIPLLYTVNFTISFQPETKKCEQK